jgi:cytochrome c
MRRATLVIAFALAACGQPAPAPKADAPAPTAEPAPAPAAPAAAPAAAAGPSAETIAARVGALPAPFNAGDYQKGRTLFAQCRSCHTAAAGEPNRVGPNLHGVFGRKAGALESFRTYSKGLKDSGITWDAATMDRWIANPRDVVAVNNMVFPGLRKEEDRRDVIAYLAVETAN